MEGKVTCLFKLEYQKNKTLFPIRKFDKNNNNKRMILSICKNVEFIAN